MNYMQLAYKEAIKSFKKGEVPVGAVIVYNSKVISKAHNKRQKSKNVFGHAEILAIQKAAKKLQDWRLNDCDLYVTLKPCSMCEQLIRESRIKNVYYCFEKESNKKEYNKTTYKQTNVCAEYKKILTDFFKKQRNK